jgi:arabinose-5-phosphate isomerase
MDTMTTNKQNTQSAKEVARRVLDLESRAVASLIDKLDANFDQAVELMTSSEGRIVVTGMGKSGLICQKIAATLSSTGCPSFFMHPAEAVHGDLGMLVAGDVLLALSNSGETAEIIRLLEIVRRLGAKIVALSGNPDSTLARFADAHLDVGVDKEACSLDLIPTSSSTAALAMGDALAIAIHEGRGLSSKDFARYHPGGRLGRRLIQVDTLMHHGSDLPVVGEAATMTEAVEEINHKRLGMTCVIDDTGRLVGIITDGDLRRQILERPAPLEGSVTEMMIRSPQTISAAALAGEALKLMEDKKITSLPVIDNEQKLVGVIQIHDLWRTELF